MRFVKMLSPWRLIFPLCRDQPGDVQALIYSQHPFSWGRKEQDQATFKITQGFK